MADTPMERDPKPFCQIVKDYRSLAAEALDVAESPVPSRYQEAYRTMARHWLELAHELEIQLGEVRALH